MGGYVLASWPFWVMYLQMAFPSNRVVLYAHWGPLAFFAYARGLDLAGGLIIASIVAGCLTFIATGVLGLVKITSLRVFLIALGIGVWLLAGLVAASIAL